MINKTEKSLILFIEGVLFSYSQVFFSKQKIFALILLAVTFFDWIAGLSGLIAVLVSNIAATVLGFRKTNVSQGFYGFNSLLVGLGLGMLYQPDIEFFFVLVFASLFTFFLSIWLEGFFGKYGLPYLSWPFLFGLWMVTLASRQFAALDMSERGIFMLNEIYQYGGMKMVKLYFWTNDLQIHEAIKIYFRSLAAIFFQYHLLAGLLVAIGLLIYSRIAFLLSVVGFFSAYYFYILFGANLADLSYGYIGFNFILTAIAIGGFFIVPSKYSFLWVVLLTPIISFIITATSAFFSLVNLSIYSLAFNIVVVMFLYILKFRERNHYNPELVAVQHFSPEQNLYAQQNYKTRFDVNAWIELTLPLLGEWKVTQGHSGEHTHREDWRHAWDFEIFDDEGQNFGNNGLEPKDYYCFGKPVLAPADGFVQEIQDGIPDNPIGEMNLGNNWGNTIVIKHAENLYTKLSHLKIGSIKVYKGTYVKRGEIIAHCGNSGRSVVPHLHFQVQSDPFIGSKTKDYPVANYLVKTGGNSELKIFDRPTKGQTISNVVKNDSLFKAFNFVPGQMISFEVSREESDPEKVEWEVKSDMYNYTFLECSGTESKAYFRNNGNLFYFTGFSGDKKSLLYYFYLGAYKVLLGYYHHLEVKDTFPLNSLRTGLLVFLQDFIAPFYMFMHADFSLKYFNLEDDLSTSRIEFHSDAQLKIARKVFESYSFEITVSGGRIELFKVKRDDLELSAKEVES
ncbi:MAG: urea transporter [Bacteroidales bacterium]|nr:urea transporter [Bacteroidales bacterium]